ncbi:hypothetical protein ABT364_15825 [Massilia sp. SR12]
MNQARTNMYAGIHKALRHYMSDTESRLSRTDADDSEELQATLAQVRALLATMRQHMEHERDFVHPALHARRPGSAQVTQGDHDHHDWAIDKLLALCEHCATAAGSARQAHLEHLHLQLSVFIGENLIHMNLEETENNAVLWACYTDAELHAIHEQIVATIPPEAMQATMRWMIPALNPAERAGMLLGMRAGMPPPVFAGVLEMTRGLVSARDMQKLEAALAAPQALAA